MAAGKPGDDILCPNVGNEENRQPLGLAVENAEETSDVSASLFKEISSEEEMEVLSGTPHRARMEGDILGMNGVAHADSEGDSGEDGSLFEEIGGDDSHFGALGGVQESAYERAANGDNGAGFILGGSLRFQTEDVPFIRAARGDLDGPLDGPLASLQREDGTSLQPFGEKLSSIFEDLRAKEESPLAGVCRDYRSSCGGEGGERRVKEESLLAGVCRDYRSSSGGERGDDGVQVILADPNREGVQDSAPVKGQEGNIEHVQETLEVLMIPLEQGTNVQVVSGLTLTEQRGIPILPMAIEGNTLLDAGELADEGVTIVSSSPQDAPKKRGRASRELGALLMDAKGTGRGKKAAGLQADVSDAFALAVVRGTTEAGGTLDGVVLEPSEDLRSRVEVRVTRSRASGRLGGKNENLDVDSLDGPGSQDVTTKRTGKRSAARGGRLGWGNGLENSADGGSVLGESLILTEDVPGEGETGAELETGQVGEDPPKESVNVPESKSGGRVKKARAKGKQTIPGRETGQLGRSNSHIEESHTAEITTGIIQDVKGLETENKIDEILIIPPSAGTLLNLDAKKTEAGEPAKALEPDSGGRRRSNRHKAKLGVHPELDLLMTNVLPGQSKRKQQRKGASATKDLPQIPAGCQQPNQEVGSSEENLKLSERNLSQNVGGNAAVAGSLDSSKEVQAKADKTVRAKSTSRKVSQNRDKKNVEVSETFLEGPSNSVLGGEPVRIGLHTDAQLSLDNETSTGEAGSRKESSDNGQNSASRLEKIGEETCLDTSKSDLTVSMNEQGEGFAKHPGTPDDQIGPVKVAGPGNDVDFALLPDKESDTHYRIEEGGNKLRSRETLSEKLETCSSSPVGELVEVVELNSKAELEVRNLDSVEPVVDDTVVHSEAGGNVCSGVKSETGLTIVNGNFNMTSNVYGEDMGFVKESDGATQKEGAVDHKATELSFAEATSSGRDEDIAEINHLGAVKKPSKGKSARGGKVKPVKGKLGGSRKHSATKKQKVDSKQGSEADVKAKGPARKRAATKKKSTAEASSLATGEESAIGAKKKTSTGSKKGKMKLNCDDVAPSQGISMVDGLEPSTDIVVDDTKEPVRSNKAVMDISDKELKSKKKGRGTTAGIEACAPKKRRKTGKPEGLQLKSEPCSAATAVNPSGDGPTVGLPVCNESESKASQRGKAGPKKSQKAISGKKVGKTTPVGDKGKRPRKQPGTKVKSRGATVKVLSSIKDQSSEDRVQTKKNKSARPKAAKSNSKLQADPIDRCAVGDGEAGHFEQGDVAVGSASSNQVTIADSAIELQSDVVVRDKVNATEELQSEVAVRDIDSGAVGEDVSSGVTEGGENKPSEKGIDSDAAETGAARKSWVLCDDCNKWRCIPVELADQIESTNARWSCRENPDKAFQDCTVPQEKSNAEINAELQISEVSVCEEGDDKDAVDSKSMNLGAANEENKPAVWKRIKRNIFQHRRRKVLEIDEMMVCQCTPPEEGGVGCGENCLNRMLSIECVAEQCPCGEACSNQQFQKRTYAPISMYRCGKKGFGLRVVENVSKGTFIIEYVGEVLDVGAFEARQQEYARNGQKHFYFMTLNTNEVIDACSKGNYGRFINHSCEPNCRTEKWMVNGEVCIGLFAVRDIGKDEEVTFDYNYVRVCGAAAKKCECGSSQCRGFIGGDPLTPKAVVESDSEDEEDLEPVMIDNSEDEDNYVDENKLAPCKKPRVEAEFQEETTATRTSGLKRKLNVVKERASSAVKRVKTSSSARRSNSMNYKGLTLDVSGGRYESPRTISFSDVQEKLDDMLDRNGGLRKKRDAAKHYLKLLVLTSASGDSRKDAIACSVRDLSLLLDALLKTTSRTVLSDIMNKNGLRMLHNLIKQLRRQWDKTPILRKLLKVLDLLASERVLTTDLITSGPPCSGMESFSESLFELTRHKDTEVVYMVRRFRNKWMPPRIWDKHYIGCEKPFPMQSLSPVVMHQSEQLNMGSSRFQSPQHPKQLSIVQPLTGSEVSRPSSSDPSLPQAGDLPGTQSRNGLAGMEEGAKSKDDGATKLPLVGEDSTSGVTPQIETKQRKRPSRWDAPAKVENPIKDPSDPASTGRASSAAPQALKQAVGLSVPQPVWVFPASGSFQDSARLQNGGMSGQLQMQSQYPPVTGARGSGPGLHLPHSQLLQGMPPTQHIPGATPMQMQPHLTTAGPPPTQLGLQQTPNLNAMQYGQPLLPGRVFPYGPPMQLGPGVQPAQGISGSTPQIPIRTGPTALGYVGDPRPPPMQPTAPYVQWRPPPSAPNFSNSFPFDPTQMPSLQPAWPLQSVDDGTHRVSSSDANSRGKRKKEDAEAEPPVPGLSPRPPPPEQPSMPDSFGGQEISGMPGREYYEAQWIPQHYMQAQGMGQEYYGADPRDGTWGHPAGEYWDTPEGEGFRADVFALVSMRVHKHHKLRTKDLDRFCRKMADVIVRKEVAKFIEHRNQGIEKIIVKTKLIEKVDSYVDNQVGIYLKKIDKSHRG